MAALLVVWDFDWTLINENSDTYVIDRCGGAEATQKMKELGGMGMLWTERMSTMLQHLTGELGVTRRSITQCLRDIPVFPENLDVVRILGEREDVVQVIVSDANTLFIESYLEEKGLRGCFDAVYTNPVEWKSGRGGDAGTVEGRTAEGEKTESTNMTTTTTTIPPEGRVLHVRPFVDPGQPHGCATCAETPNMCKGAIVDMIRDRFPARAPLIQKVVYLGDGRGDFCGACRLSRGDTILCRRGYSLSKKLSETPPDALDVAIWENGKDILQAFQQRSLLYGEPVL